MEHVGVLGDVADRVLQRLQRHVAHVVAVDAHGARVDVVQPGDQVGDRGLAGAGGADQRDHLPGHGGEGDVVEHQAVVAGLGAGDGLQAGQRHLVGARVAERDVVELDLAGVRGSTTASGLSWIIEGRSSTSKTRSKLTSAVITSMRTLESPCSGPSSRSSRVASASSVPTVSVAVDGEVAADAVHERGGERGDQHQRGAEHPGDERDADAEVADHAGLGGELRVLLVAAAEQLEQHRAADVEPLGHRVAEVGVALHLVAGQAGELAADPAGGDQQEREHQQAQQRDLPAQREHRDADDDHADRCWTRCSTASR